VDRCALFVDAGYVLADGAMAVHGTRRRESVSWDYAGLLQLLASLAAERSGLPLLRCYWYEATVEGRRGVDHDALADLPGVKLRLAKMRPGRREGVESEIHRDLATLARNKAVSDAMIISAEEDLAGVIADVQDLGMRVTMLHITVDGDWTISRALRQECDDIVEINAVHLRPYVDLISGAEPSHADEAEPGSAVALRRLGANGHNGAPAPAYADSASVVRMPSFTPSLAGGHDNGYQDNGYHDNGYQMPPVGYPEPVPDYQRAMPQPGPVQQPGPARQLAASAASPGGPASAADDVPAGHQEPSAAPGIQGTPGAQGDDTPTMYPMPAQMPMPMPPQGPASPVAASAGRPEVPPRAENYPAPVPAEAGAGQFADEWSGNGRAYPVPDFPAYSPGAPREPALGDPRQGDVGGVVPFGQPERMPVPAGPGAQVRRLQNGYSPGQQPVSGPQPVPGHPQPVAGPQPVPGHPVGGLQPVGPHHIGGPQPAAGPQPVAGPPLGQQVPGVGQNLPGGPVPPNALPPGGSVPPNALPPGSPVPPNALASGPGPAPGQANGMPAANGVAPGNGLAPVNGLAQTSGLMSVPGGQPPPGGPGGPPGGPAAQAMFGGQPPQAVSLADAVQSAHEEGQEFGGSVARDAPALWLEAVLARKPRMPSDLEARLLQGSSLPIDFLLHDEVRHALRRGFWDALERARR
jgi:hypothetical protein